VINTEQLRELQAEYEPMRLADQSRHKKFEELRRSFEKRFPRNKISQLKPDDYVQGKGNKESFCYWVEIKLAGLGNIQGTPDKNLAFFTAKEKAPCSSQKNLRVKKIHLDPF
jgi:hypothetical protein